MFVSENLNVNEKGNLTIGGVDTVELTKEYGTPLYVMDEDLIRKHCRSFKNSIDKFYGGKGLVCQQIILLLRNVPCNEGRGNRT